MHQQMVSCFRICGSPVTRYKRKTDDTPTKNDATGKAIGVDQYRICKSAHSSTKPWGQETSHNLPKSSWSTLCTQRLLNHSPSTTEESLGVRLTSTSSLEFEPGMSCCRGDDSRYFRLHHRANGNCIHFHFHLILFQKMDIWHYIWNWPITASWWEVVLPIHSSLVSIFWIHQTLHSRK